MPGPPARHYWPWPDLNKGYFSWCAESGKESLPLSVFLERNKMKNCPRCHQETLEDDPFLNSLSRRDNRTYICNVCGDDEDQIDFGKNPVTEMEKRFIKELEEIWLH